VSAERIPVETEEERQVRLVAERIAAANRAPTVWELQQQMRQLFGDAAVPCYIRLRGEDE
jgi:hypothetical protein